MLRPSNIVLLVGVLLILSTLFLAARSAARRAPRTVEGWTEQTLVALHRVPFTGALYAAMLVAFLYVRTLRH